MNKKLFSCLLLSILSFCIVGFNMPSKVKGEDYLSLRVMDLRRVAGNELGDTLYALVEIKNTTPQQVEFGLNPSTVRKVKIAYGFSYTYNDAGFGTRGLPIEKLCLEPQESVIFPIKHRIGGTKDIDKISGFRYTFNYLCVDGKILFDEGVLRLNAPASDSAQMTSMHQSIEKDRAAQLTSTLVQIEGQHFLRVAALTGDSAYVVDSLCARVDGDCIKLTALTKPALLSQGGRGDFKTLLFIPEEVNSVRFGLKDAIIWQRDKSKP